MPLTGKTRKAISILVKTVVIGLAFLFIIRKLNDNKGLGDFWHLVNQIGLAKVRMLLGFVVLLMPVNWLLEAVKWRYLVWRIERISFFKSVESVFCGLTWAVFTPNRIGEFGGRVFFLDPDKRGRGIVAMAVGSIGQLMTTWLLGGIGLTWFIHRFLALNEWTGYAITFMIVLFCFLALLFYFNIRLLNNILRRVRFLEKLRRYFRVLTYYSTAALLRVFILCLLRFSVFTFQYYLVINLLIPSLLFHEIVLMVFVVLFVQSSLPSISVLDLGVRGATATYFFAYLSRQDIAILSASSYIWLVNLIIPAILGAGFVLKLRFFGKQHS